MVFLRYHVFPTPAFDDGVPGHGGCTMVQVFTGMDSELLHGVPMKSETEVPDTILTFIWHYDAMEILMSDNAKSETSFAVHDILCLYTIKDHQSEPHYQHQNPVEWQIQDIKHTVKSIMDRVACPSGYWLLLTLHFVCYRSSQHPRQLKRANPSSGHHWVSSRYFTIPRFSFLGGGLCGRSQGK